jgi:SWI/SNF-related matrix-associated actin-dependent regulator 1 of chromatin subfamily A
MSYQLATKRASEIEKFSFKIVIADEAHYLKSRDSLRSKNLVPILESCKRTILMSGTPVLARPMEIYNLMKILRPDICPKFSLFADRYCNPQVSRFGMDYTGASCTLELHYVLSTTFMVRRLKKDVLD